MAETKEKKPNAINRFFRETIGELRKVSWPTTQETLDMTWKVLAVLGIMSLILGGLDALYSFVITRLLAV
jgi:preprotein translocase subunit SecE